MNQIAQQFQLAKQAYAQGNYTQAVRICDQLTNHLGARDDLLNVKAMSLLALGHLETADKAMRAALN